MHLIIYTDGGARGNPGPAGLGVAIYDADRNLLRTVKKFLGVKTNNQAEYQAVIAALEEAKKLDATVISFFLDSELVVRQLRGEYKIKNSAIAPLAHKVLMLLKSFERVDFSHVPRQQNKIADRLVNEAIDEGVNSPV